MNTSDIPEFQKCIRALFGSFGLECTPDNLNGYWLGLSDLDLPSIQKAVAVAIRSTKFVAKPFELRELTGTVVSEESRAQLAWLDVQRALRIGAYKSIDFDDKLCNAVIRGLGGWPNFVARFTSAKEEEFARHAFIKAYRNFAASSVSGDSCKPLPGLSQVSFVGGVQVGPVRIACDPERAMLPCPIREVVDEVKRIGELVQ
jgi:hypothetical protein